jgi:hypothetical protein
MSNMHVTEEINFSGGVYTSCGQMIGYGQLDCTAVVGTVHKIRVPE